MAKHSKSFNLIDTLAVGVDRIQRNFEPLQRQLETWRQTQITDDRAKLILYQAFVEGELEARGMDRRTLAKLMGHSSPRIAEKYYIHVTEPHISLGLSALWRIFGGLSLLLAMIGTYGVISGNVSERTREIGIRMAGGADRSRIMWLVLRQGMTLAGIGVIIGIGVSFLVTRMMMSLLFSTSATDPLTFVLVGGLLLLVALGACSIPACERRGCIP